MKTSNRRRPGAALAAVVVLALAQGPGLLFGQTAPASSASPSDKETARALFNAGLDLRDEGKLKEACEKFRLADQLAHTPVTALELGRAHMAIGELMEAREAWLSVERIEKKADESKKTREARLEAAKLALHIQPRIPSIQVNLKGLPPGARATVTIDAQSVAFDMLDIPRKVNPGTHEVVVQMFGIRDRHSTVAVVEGQQEIVSVDLTPKPEDAAAVPSEANADAPASSASSASSEPAVTTPEEVRPPREPIAPLETAPRVEPPPHRRPISIFDVMVPVGFSIAGVGLLVGTVTGLISLDKVKALELACPDKHCPPAQWEELDGARSLGWASTVSFGIAALGAAAGMVGLLALPDRAPEKAQIRPWIGPFGVGLSGSF